jgi:hypothetical protein
MKPIILKKAFRPRKNTKEHEISKPYAHIVIHPVGELRAKPNALIFFVFFRVHSWITEVLRIKRLEPTMQRNTIPRNRMVCLHLAAIGIGLALAGCTHPQPAPSVTTPVQARTASPGPLPTEEGSHSKPDLSGHWLLNAEASDDPLERAREAMQARRQAKGGGRGMGGGGMGRGGGMGGGQAGRGGTEGGLPSGELAGLLAPAQELHITHVEPRLLIADERDQRQRLYTDFRGASVSANGGLHQRVATAGWEGAGLVVESTMIGNKLTQDYRIDPGTGQLVIASTARVSAGAPISFRLVYDRRKSEGKTGESSLQFVGTAQGETP